MVISGGRAQVNGATVGLAGLAVSSAGRRGGREVGCRRSESEVGDGGLGSRSFSEQQSGVGRCLEMEGSEVTGHSSIDRVRVEAETVLCLRGGTGSGEEEGRNS